MDAKTKKTQGRIGSLAINQTILLVLGVVVLAILVGFYIFLGDKAAQMIADAFKLPSVGK